MVWARVRRLPQHSDREQHEHCQRVPQRSLQRRRDQHAGRGIRALGRERLELGARFICRSSACGNDERRSARGRQSRESCLRRGERQFSRHASDESEYAFLLDFLNAKRGGKRGRERIGYWRNIGRRLGGGFGRWLEEI